MTKTLDVLLIEAHSGDGAVDADRLEAAGHRVHRCRSRTTEAATGAMEAVDDLCRGVTRGDCPLDHGIDVVLLVRKRIARRPTTSEGGVSCALRAGVPVVEDGPDILDPFEPWITARAGQDVAGACAAAVEQGFAPLRHDIAVRIDAILRGAGIDPRTVHSRLSYEHPRLTVELKGPVVSASVQQALGVRVLDSVRECGRTFGQVDVAYEPVR